MRPSRKPSRATSSTRRIASMTAPPSCTSHGFRIPRIPWPRFLRSPSSSGAWRAVRRAAGAGRSGRGRLVPVLRSSSSIRSRKRHHPPIGPRSPDALICPRERGGRQRRLQGCNSSGERHPRSPVVAVSSGRSRTASRAAIRSASSPVSSNLAAATATEMSRRTLATDVCDFRDDLVEARDWDQPEGLGGSPVPAGSSR